MGRLNLPYDLLVSSEITNVHSVTDLGVIEDNVLFPGEVGMISFLPGDSSESLADRVNFMCIQALQLRGTSFQSGEDKGGVYLKMIEDAVRYRFPDISKINIARLMRKKYKIDDCASTKKGNCLEVLRSTSTAYRFLFNKKSYIKIIKETANEN